MDSAEFVDLAKTIVTVAGVIVTAYFSYRAVRSSRRTEQIVDYQLNENSGGSALDKINKHIDDRIESVKQFVRDRIGNLEKSTNRRLDAIDGRIDSLDRREASNYDRISELQKDLDKLRRQ